MSKNYTLNTTFLTAANSNNVSNDNAIFTQYRRHCFRVTADSSLFSKYSGEDVESASFNFRQTKLHDYAVTVKTYWTVSKSSSNPFAKGTSEIVTTNSSAYPTDASQQCVSQLRSSTSGLTRFSINITSLIKYVFDSYKSSFYIWQRFGVSSPKQANGSSTNIGSWTISVEMKDGSVFMYTEEGWKATEFYSKTVDSWVLCEGGVTSE